MCNPTFRRITPKSLHLPKRPPSTFPTRIRRPHYVLHQGESPWNPGIPDITKNGAAVESLKYMGQLASRCLSDISCILKPGIATVEIDHEMLRWAENNNVYPSPLGYKGFPASLCTSINNVVAHGIPDEYANSSASFKNSTLVVDGDIINLDVTLYGSHPLFPDVAVHADTSATFSIGKPSHQSTDLLYAARNSLYEAIRICGPGVPYREIGRIIGKVANKAGFEIVPDLCGHGIGLEFHQFPVVLHTYEPENDVIMEIGHVFTIEPHECLYCIINL